MSRFETDDIYIVAEIGQNHNGELELAKNLIEEAYISGCSAVKLAKRDLGHELSKESYNRLYNNPNSFGATYGEHRKFLEFSPEQHRILKKYANNRKMDYFLSVCDIPSLVFALTLDPPVIKIPSKEVNNIPLIEESAKYGKPIIISMGLSTEDEFDNSIEIIEEEKIRPIICVCTSQYPCEYDNVNLYRLFYYSSYKIGFSSHTPDPMLGVAAVAMGATYIEYHITLDREMKGSDHICSLELEEFGYLVDSINTLQLAMGDGKMLRELPYYLKPIAEKMKKHKCDDGVYRI